VLTFLKVGFLRRWLNPIDALRYEWLRKLIEK